MSDFLELLKIAKDTVDSFFTQRKAVSSKAWEEVVLALDKLTELTTLHIKTVVEVNAPLLTFGDIAETSRRYSLLVNNPDFPQGYGTIRGILEATHAIRTFQGASTQEKVKAVLNDLFEFQYGVFTLGWDSYHVSDAIAACARIAGNPQSNADEIEHAGAPLILSYTNLFKDAPMHTTSQRTTSIPELISLVQTWCREWQRYIQRKLYDGRGLNYSVSQLRMQHYA